VLVGWAAHPPHNPHLDPVLGPPVNVGGHLIEDPVRV
jgi:hypothetical protein